MRSNSQQMDALPTQFSVGLGELIAIVWRRKFCLALCLIASLALGGVYFVKAERVYEVKCRLLVEKQELPLGESVQNHRALRDLEFLGTQAEILGSAAVISQVVDRIHWPVPYKPGVSPVAMLKERISVRPVLGTNVLSVSLQADDAERAVQATEALIESYRSYKSRAEHDVHADVLEMLAKSEKEVRDDLQQLEEQYRQLRERSPLIATYKNGVDIQLAHVDQLGRRLAETRGRRVELENQLRIASTEASKTRAVAESDAQRSFLNASLVLAARSDGTDVEVPIAAEAHPGRLGFTPQTFVGANLPGAPDMADIQNQIVRAKALEKELYSRFGHKHPEIRAVEEQIASLQSQEQKALQAGHELLRRELETVIANEKQLSELCNDELSQTKHLDSYCFQEQQMISQLTRVQDVHDSIISQLRQWKLTGQIVSDGGSPIRISVLESPVVPLRPVWPSPRILFGICGAIGLITGFGLIAFLEQRTRNVRHILQPSDRLVTQLSRA